MFVWTFALLCAALGFCQDPPAPPLPGSCAARLASAKQALYDRRFTEAERLLRISLSEQPTCADAQYLLALTLFREDRPKDSLAEYTRAAQLKRPSAIDLRYVALDYVLLNDYTDADTWITRSAAGDSTAAETWYTMGRIKYSENRFAEAESSFRKALLLQPQSVKAENNLGLTLEALNRADEAIEAYRQAIKWQLHADQPSEQPLLNLGVLLINRNQLDEALSLLKQAVLLAPHNSKIHTALGKLYRERNAFPQAQAEFEEAVAVEPDNAALHFQLGQIYRREGLEDRAKSELARASTLNATHSSPER